MQKKANMKRFDREGKHVSATLLKKKGVTTVFLIALFTSTLIVTCFMPKVAAVPTISISPLSGYVGDAVRVTGTIDTANGTYEIFFDNELVANGTASPEKAVNTTFSVPHRYQSTYFVQLYDVQANTTSPSTSFIINTKYYVTAVMPRNQTQLIEGQSTTIRVNVTGGETRKPHDANVTVRLPQPLSTVYYNSSLHFTNTSRLGEYMAEGIYPRDFGSGAHTNYAGNYTMAFNTTLASGFFNVGFTNKTEYHRYETVTIRGADYTQPDERVWINITSAEKTVFSTNVPATEGFVNANWTIPWNATYGTYNITITNSTSSGTVKPIRDTQVFAISETIFQCQIPIKNLDNESVNEIVVAACDEKDQIVTAAYSNSSGWAKLSLEAYRYSFKAFWKIVEVGNTSVLDINKDIITQTIVCRLAHIKLHIEDVAKKPLPLISIDLKYNYTTFDGEKISDLITLETDNTGFASLQNTFINMSYLIEAKRYGYVFNRTNIGNLTASQWINITCPSKTLFIHVVDSKGLPLSNVSVNVTEWSSGLLVGNNMTNDLASVSLNLVFGRYKVKVYNYSAELDSIVLLNETVVDAAENLIEDLPKDEFFETIHCRISNLSPSVLVVDYFGQPIPNAEVKIQRFSEIEQKWVEIAPTRRTDSNGITLLPNTGGDYSISIYVLGQLSSIKSYYIGETHMLVFKIDKYATIGGLILETSQLVAYIALGLLIISLGIALTYKKILQKFTKK